MQHITRIEATELNQNWFFTGVPCKRGHVDKRGVKNRTCYTCQQTQSLTFRNNNPEYHYNYNKEYYPRNKEKSQKHSTAYYQQLKEKNPSLHKFRNDQHHLTYRQRHPQRLRDRNKEYSSNNKGVVNAQNAKRRAKKLNATPLWANLNNIREIYIECQAINTVNNDKFVVDHIIPLQGKLVSGLHVEYNLRIISANENSVKSNKLIEEFVE